jgi:hypothetical protein
MKRQRLTTFVKTLHDKKYLAIPAEEMELAYLGSQKCNGDNNYIKDILKSYYKKTFLIGHVN